MGRYRLVVFSNPVEGREDEFNDWYSNQHLNDVVDLPGFRSAERFKAQALLVGDLKHQYLAFYEMDADSHEAVAAATQGLVSAGLAVSAALNADVAAGVFEDCAPTLTRPEERSVKHRLVGLTDPVEGREDEFNTAYDQHMDDVVNVPGFTSGNRFKLHSVIGGEFPSQYLAVVGMEGDTPSAVESALKALFDANLVKNDALRGDKAIACVFEACSAKVSAREEEAPG